MKKIMILFSSFFLFSQSHSQITKGNWLVGGNANLSSAQYRGYVGANEDLLTIGIQPKVGYFLKDKFAVGLLANYSFHKAKIPTNSTSTSTFGLGPFVRYYFLQNESRANILVGPAIITVFLKTMLVMAVTAIIK